MREENKLFIELVNKAGSQANFCMLTGLNKGQCSQYYNSKVKPRYSTIKRLSASLGFEIKKNKLVKIKKL